MTVKRLLFATTNAGKLREFRALIRIPGLALITPEQLGLDLRVEEGSADYAENSCSKALAYARASGMHALGDDTGLEVDALDGAPGALSARIAGPGKTDRQRREKLLELLRPHTQPWTARFRCVVALAGPEGEVDLAEGDCPGTILSAARGKHGFGYDPIFLVADSGLTMAELPMAEKNRISHRAVAVQAIMPRLLRRLNLEP